MAVQYLSFEFATTKPLVHAVGSVSVIDKRADTNATLGRGNTKVMSPFTNLLSQNQ
ncbi:MAG: hypothetical protein QM530_00550 [Phycisphaerales bacterium]|nr:hypothetical protein [Phycisphaerales bacterium]